MLDNIALFGDGYGAMLDTETCNDMVYLKMINLNKYSIEEIGLSLAISYYQKNKYDKCFIVTMTPGNVAVFVNKELRYYTWNNDHWLLCGVAFFVHIDPIKIKRVGNSSVMISDCNIDIEYRWDIINAEWRSV
jgi:hypothetical protein